MSDVYYVLFKHKWKILGFSLVGFLAAAATYRFWPETVYKSDAKLFIRYIQENSDPLTVSDDAQIKSTDQRGETIINSEVEILTSMDVSKQVALTLGPERVLEAFGGGSDLDAAAGAIRSGLTASAPRGSRVVGVSFKHPDRAITQQALSTLISEYLKRHLEIHMTSGMFDDLLQKETQTLREHLQKTEEELRAKKEEAGVLSLAEAKQAYSEQMAKTKQQILETAGLIAERNALLSDYESSQVPFESVPTGIAQEYRAAVGALDALNQKYQELFATFTAESTAMTMLRRRIAESTAVKERLESEHPALRQADAVALNGQRESNGARFNPDEERSRIRALVIRRQVLQEHLAQIQKEANDLSELELSISDLERRKDLQESQYRYFSTTLEQTRINEALGSGRVSNISIIQAPTPPVQQVGKLYKVVGGLAVGGLAFGLALAFCLELFLDQSVRRPIEIESILGLPLFFSIPNIAGRLGPGALPVAQLEAPESIRRFGANSDDKLASYFDALRDRLLFFFEMRGVVKKPKLVAVTSCGGKAGVSTVAAGLAASLSKTGEGNVLLVDMNMGSHTPYHFRDGKVQVGLDELLEGGHREGARVQQNLFVVPHATGNERLSRILPSRFTNLIPRLRASDYDYIIFDMPAVNQVSVTPQLARNMDMVFLLVESEKTNRDAVKRASNLLTQASCTLSVIVNRTRNYLPRPLLQEI